MNGKRKARIIILPVFVSLVMLVIYGLIEAPHLTGAESEPFLLGLLLVGTWLASSLWIASRWAARDPLAVPRSASPMSTGEVYFLILVVWDLLAIGLIITAATPFWLTPEYVLGSLRNLAAVLHLIHRLVL